MSFSLFARARSTFTENLNLKLLSFAFALLLYSMVHGSQNAQRTVSLSLVTLQPPNRVLTHPLPPSVRVTLRGAPAVLDDIHTDDIGSIQVDLRNVRDLRVVLDSSLVHVPAGVRVEQIEPPALDVTWEEEVQREVPIQVSVVGTPAPGFVIKAAPTAEPSKARTRGAKSEVNAVQFLRAQAFDVTGLAEGRYSRDLPLERPGGTNLTLDESTAHATVDIARQMTEELFSKVVVVVIGPPKGKSLPGDVDVRLTCPPEIVRALRPEQVVARVAVTSSAASGSEVHPVEVSIERCEARITPSQVVVRW